MVRTAWVADDAFVTLRTVDHLVHGRGLVYNAVERVQGYTHPLWMLLLAAAYAVTGEPWLTTMALGAAVTAVAVGLLARTPSPTVPLAVLLGSKAWVDFATSGLENPLTNALLVAFAAAAAERRAEPAVLLAALLGTTRLDALVLVGPALIPMVWASPRALRQLWPLLAWHAFALVYYGDPLPNTAHAKLATGVGLGERLVQGGHWLRWNAAVDPLTVGVLALGAVGIPALAWRDRAHAGSVALVAGAALYVAYAVWIGGDFMGGRFLAAPLTAVAIGLGRVPWGRIGVPVAIGVVLAGVLPAHAPLRAGPAYVRAPAADGIVDERGYYWRGTGFLAAGAGWEPTHEFWTDGRRERGAGVAVKSVIGMYGFAAGPEKHVVDRLGLTDPLLARLPAEPGGNRRPGHVRRAIPAGYPAAAPAGAPLADPAADAIWTDVKLATRGPLFTRERWGAIGRLARR